MKSKTIRNLAALFLVLILAFSSSLPAFASVASKTSAFASADVSSSSESTAPSETPAASKSGSTIAASSYTEGEATSSSTGGSKEEPGTAASASSSNTPSKAPAPAAEGAGVPLLQTAQGALPAGAVIIPQNTLTVSASSERPTTHPATNAIDGKGDTLWHTEANINPPFDFFLNLGAEKTVSHIEITGRSGVSSQLNGYPGRLDVYSSTDGNNYTAKVASVDWSGVSLASGMRCVIEISPAVTTRYLKLDIQDTKIAESPYKPAAIAELNLYYASPFAALEALIEEAEELLTTLQQQEDITLLETAIETAKAFVAQGDTSGMAEAKKALQDVLDAIREKLLDKQKLTSPNGVIQVGFWLDADGRPWYEVKQDGNSLVKPSSLGMSLADGNGGEMSSGFTLTDVQETSANTYWQPGVKTIRGTIPDVYSQSTFRLKDGKGRRVDIIFRAYDEGVGFRYSFPEEDNALSKFVIRQENSQFAIPDDTTAIYLGTLSQAIPSSAPVQTLNRDHYAPMLFTYADGTSMALFESDLYDYARLKLRSNGGIITSNVNWNNATIQATAPFVSPWRGMIVADSLGGIQEKSYMVQNLASPQKLQDTSWIKTGKLIREAKLTEENTKKCIDYAAANGIDYIMYDSGWYGTENDHDMSPMEPFLGDFPYMVGDSAMRRCDVDVRDAAKWAEEKGVGVILYVNHIHLEKYDLDEVFRTYKEWGIDGVKFGFVNVGNQYWSKWLADAVATAAKYQLVVKIHDEYIPTGLDRAYPNLLNIEGVLGDEGSPNYVADLKQVFTRTFLGPTDHTFCYPMMQYRGAIKTDAFSLASPMLYYAPLHSLNWYGGPDDYPEGKYPELKFWADLPGEWDESRHIDSRFGEYFTMARRNGSSWFLGSLSAIDRTLEFTPDFLQDGKTYVAECYTNSAGDTLANNKVSIHKFLVNNKTAFNFSMMPGGGLALRMVLATPEDIKNLPFFSRHQLDLKNLVSSAETTDTTLYTTRSLKESDFVNELKAAKAILSGPPMQDSDYQNALNRLRASLGTLEEKTYFGVKIDQSELSVRASDERTETHPAVYAIDGKANTLWHTSGGANPPFEYFIDLGQEYALQKIEITGRLGSGSDLNGFPALIDVYTSVDGKTYTQKVASVDWKKVPLTAGMVKNIEFDAGVKARYLKLHIKDTNIVSSSYRPAAIAELNVYESPFAELDALIEKANRIYGRIKDPVEKKAVGDTIEQAVHYTESATGLTELAQHLQALQEIIKQYPEADKAFLQQLVTRCQALEEQKYTPGSWQKLQEALAAADTVLKDTTVSQTDVETAKEQLQKAYDSLVLRAVPAEPGATPPPAAGTSSKAGKASRPATSRSESESVSSSEASSSSSISADSSASTPDETESEEQEVQSIPVPEVDPPANGKSNWLLWVVLSLVAVVLCVAIIFLVRRNRQRTE